MTDKYLVSLQEATRNHGIGNKASNLRFLIDKGFPVPTTYVCTREAHAAYLQDNVQVVERLKAELEAILDVNRRYAVRSSANLEDELEASFAGQFKTVLDVQVIGGILQAIWSIWSTADLPSIRVYQSQQDGDAPDVRMAVLLQEMISP